MKDTRRKKEEKTAENKKRRPKEPNQIKPNEEQPTVAEERNGVIPEGMDFKKFIGCGG